MCVYLAQSFESIIEYKFRKTFYFLLFILDELLLSSSSSNIHANNDKRAKHSSFSTTNLSHLSEVTDRFDSNIELAQSLLDMLDSLNHNNSSSTENIDLLHMHIRQFLIEFDARICLDRKRRKRSTRKHHKVAS
jgi:hypothetical protein